MVIRANAFVLRAIAPKDFALKVNALCPSMC